MADVVRQYNAGVVALLEEALAKAREGDIDAVAIVMAASPLHSNVADVVPWVSSKGHAYTANARMNGPMELLLRHLANGVEKLRINNTMPPREVSRADYACFNGALWGVCFDFANWIMEREMERIAERAPAPLKVGFWFGRDGKAGLSEPHRQQMFDRVLRPMLALVGAVESEEAAQIGRTREAYTARGVVDRVRAGERLPRMWAPNDAVSRMEPYKDAITITLRESEEWPHRNSNIAAWLKFAGDLKAKGERVIFVRDTVKANEELTGWETCPLASTDLHARMALYQLSRMNYFVANGPTLLAIYGYANYRIFLDLQPDGHAFLSDTPTFWREKVGVEPGGQFPWVLPNQRIVWSADRYEVISAEWERQEHRAVA